jgi:acyl-CoA thioester hydrolase
MNQDALGQFSETFELPYTVVESDIDEMGHANNLQYLRWTLKAATAHSAYVGWPSSKYEELGQGFIVRSHQIKYRIPALLNDQLTIRTWVAEMQKVSSIRKYHIIRNSDGRRLAEAETNWVFVDFESGELRKIPSEIEQAFSISGD